MATTSDGAPAPQAGILTPKERMIRALTGQPPDRLPAAQPLGKHRKAGTTARPGKRHPHPYVKD